MRFSNQECYNYGWNKLVLPVTRVMEKTEFGFYSRRQLKLEIRNWAKNQARKPLVYYDTYRNMYSGDEYACFWFKHEKDALLFKLIWGGV